MVAGGVGDHPEPRDGRYRCSPGYHIVDPPVWPQRVVTRECCGWDGCWPTRQPSPAPASTPAPVPSGGERQVVRRALLTSRRTSDALRAPPGSYRCDDRCPSPSSIEFTSSDRGIEYASEASVNSGPIPSRGSDRHEVHCCLGHLPPPNPWDGSWPLHAGNAPTDDQRATGR